MSVQVLATEATLKTLSVSIQALMVSGKQMTLAVFRQLPVAEALLKSGHLQRASYWGRVRYSIKDEGDYWAVIESGGKLYRASMPDVSNVKGRVRSHQHELEKALLHQSMCLGKLNEAQAYKSRDSIPESDLLMLDGAKKIEDYVSYRHTWRWGTDYITTTFELVPK